MEFCSTRNRDLRVTSARAILQGLSEDGGLFVPTEIPQFTAEQITAMALQDYVEVAETVLAAFLPDYTAEELGDFVRQAYGKQFDDAEIACLTYPRRLCVAIAEHDALFDVRYGVQSFEKVKEYCSDVGTDWIDFFAFEGTHEFFKHDAPIERLIKDLAD